MDKPKDITLKDIAKSIWTKTKSLWSNIMRIRFKVWLEPKPKTKTKSKGDQNG